MFGARVKEGVGDDVGAMDIILEEADRGNRGSGRQGGWVSSKDGREEGQQDRGRGRSWSNRNRRGRVGRGGWQKNQ